MWYDHLRSKIVSANGDLLDVQLDVAVNNLKRVDPKQKSWGNCAPVSLLPKNPGRHTRFP